VHSTFMDSGHRRSRDDSEIVPIYKKIVQFTRDRSLSAPKERLVRGWVKFELARRELHSVNSFEAQGRTMCLFWQYASLIYISYIYFHFT